ncbi:MAG TPA: preprotein translocase subunit SecE [Bacteroidota bacterium]|jgi:preprotein translocase subunit SecE|nr:preprotein translocase subunit SecE [Bacteroidota bacterium]
MKKKIIDFFSDIVKEMKKVTWPKKEELRESTIIVIVSCLVISVFIYVVDQIIGQIVKILL